MSAFGRSRRRIFPGMVDLHCSRHPPTPPSSQPPTPQRYLFLIARMPRYHRPIVPPVFATRRLKTSPGSAQHTPQYQRACAHGWNKRLPKGATECPHCDVTPDKYYANAAYNVEHAGYIYLVVRAVSALPPAAAPRLTTYISVRQLRQDALPQTNWALRRATPPH